MNASRHRRAGVTLFELLLALPLLAFLAIAAGMLVLNAQRVSRSVDGRSTRTREMRHASAAIASVLRSTGDRDLFAWNDTLLELDATVGVAFLCGVPAVDRIDLLPSAGSDALRATWSSAPDVGDGVRVVLSPPNSTDVSRVYAATVSAVGSSATGCASSALRASVPGSVVRLTVTPAPTSAPLPGAPVRFVHRTRISLYKSSDNTWFVGMRTRTAGTWETIQPIAGPFASAAERGLRFVVRSRTGAALAARTTAMPVDTSVAALPASIDLLLRGTSSWQLRSGARESDSLLTTFAMRNR